MERALEFEKFRNIGFNNKNEKLVLNYSLEKGKMGNLVIVVGANNSGKSNVLDALTEFSNRKLTKKDLTTLSYTEADRHPSLTLCAKDGGDVYYYKLTEDRSTNRIGYPKPQFNAENVKKEAVKTLESLLKSLEEYGLKDEWQIKKTLDRLKSINDESEIKKIDDTVMSIIENIRTQSSRSYYRYAWSRMREVCNGNRYFPNENESAEEVLKKTFFNKYGITFFPNIYKYNERQINDEELQSTVDRIENSVFFKAVFSTIGMEFEEIYNAYNTANAYNNMGILEDLEDKINEKLKPIAKNFNNLYSANKDAYIFKVKLSESVNFTMKRGNKSLILGHQSTGFKWFFNLYFNFLCSKTLNAGDIVVMDEPETHLHVGGHRELRAFLKDFAIKNDITIVLATHSPFFIDMDNLDELRVISMENNFSHICNDFSTIDADDPDSLRPIKEALTVSNNVLYDPDNKVVFVEGITDYNYMVAFKNKFNIQDIVFLPIQGIGKYGSQGFKDKQKDISKRLIKIKKHSPILMVDGDGTGKSMKDTNKDSELTVFALSDVNEQFITIECLFSEADQKKFGLTKENGAYVKHSSTSALFKTFDIENVSKDTEKNFKMVFDYIEKSF